MIKLMIKVTLMIKFMIKAMIKAMIESVARITAMHCKHSGKFRRAACTLHVALSKQQHEAATCRGASQGFRNSIEKVHRKDRRGRKDRRTDRQTDNPTNGHTENNPRNDNPRTTRETDNPRTGQMDQPQGPCREAPSCRAQEAAALPATVQPPSTR